MARRYFFTGGKREFPMPITRMALMGFFAVSLAAVQVRAQPIQPKQASDCFLSNQFQGWRAPDASTIYIRVGLDRFYRLDLDGQCQKLKWTGAQLTSASRGKQTVCSAQDWDIRVSVPGDGVAQQCLVRSMTKLSPSEAAAIPKAFKP